MVRTLCGSSCWWSFFGLLVTPDDSATLSISLLGPMLSGFSLVVVDHAVDVEVGFLSVSTDVQGPLIVVLWQQQLMEFLSVDGDPIALGILGALCSGFVGDVAAPCLFC
ncbi:hypothetical protein Ancab_025411 [Ancistrocladus abbreviatus]